MLPIDPRAIAAASTRANSRTTSAFAPRTSGARQHPLQHAVLQHIMVVKRGRRVKRAMMMIAQPIHSWNSCSWWRRGRANSPISGRECRTGQKTPSVDPAPQRNAKPSAASATSNSKAHNASPSTRASPTRLRATRPGARASAARRSARRSRPSAARRRTCACSSIRCRVGLANQSQVSASANWQRPAAPSPSAGQSRRRRSWCRHRPRRCGSRCRSLCRSVIDAR